MTPTAKDPILLAGNLVAVHRATDWRLTVEYLVEAASCEVGAGYAGPLLIVAVEELLDRLKATPPPPPCPVCGSGR